MGSVFCITNFRLATLLVTIALTSRYAQAETTGNDLLNYFLSSDSSTNLRGYAYMEGVIDSENWYLLADAVSIVGPDLFSLPNSKSTKSERFKISHICFGSDQITLGQLKDVVVKYMVSYPEKRHLRAQLLIRSALLEHFACANNPINAANK